MKRGQSGLSLLLAINKPLGMSSHDVVNACRRIFEERRVGHTGTLDPLATGLLPICIGPATRLDKYLTGHDKRYAVTIGFGYETTTDDAEGEPTVRGDIAAHLEDESYASSFLQSLVGRHEQLPPQYSAVKVNGMKAYEAARSGKNVELEFRSIEIKDARFMGMHRDEQAGLLCWSAEFEVSKGTYIRSLARDIGRIVGTPAHVRSLERTSSGSLDLEEAVSLDTLASLREQAAIDPVAALGYRFAFGDNVERFVESGVALYENQVELYEPAISRSSRVRCACMSSTIKSAAEPRDGEIVSIIVANRLKALYAFDAKSAKWKPECVFSTGVFRG